MKKTTYEIIIAVVLTIAYIVTFTFGFLGNAFISAPISTTTVHKYLGGSWKVVSAYSGTPKTVIAPGLQYVKFETLEDSSENIITIYIYTFNSSESATQFYTQFTPQTSYPMQSGTTKFSINYEGLTYNIYAINGNTVAYISYVNGGISGTSPTVTQLIGLVNAII